MGKDTEVIEVTICGQSFTLRTEDREQVLKSVAEVEERIKKITEKSPMPVRDAALLAALSFSGELSRVRENFNGFRESIGKRSENILNVIQNHLVPKKDVTKNPTLN